MGHVGNEIAETGIDDVGLRVLPIGTFIEATAVDSSASGRRGDNPRGVAPQALNFCGSVEPPVVGGPTTGRGTFGWPPPILEGVDSLAPENSSLSNR